MRRTLYILLSLVVGCAYAYAAYKIGGWRITDVAIMSCLTLVIQAIWTFRDKLL